MTYNSIKVVKGNGGYGGPLVITPTEEKHKFIYDSIKKFNDIVKTRRKSSDIIRKKQRGT